MASILMNATMIGICFTEAHQEMLYRRLENLVFQHMQKADSPLHEPGLIALLGNKSRAKGKAKGKAKNMRKRKTGKADDEDEDEEAEEEGEDDNEEEGNDEEDAADEEASGLEEPEEEPEEEDEDAIDSDEEGFAIFSNLH